jgi:hypothetical protein
MLNEKLHSKSIEELKADKTTAINDKCEAKIAEL